MLLELVNVARVGHHDSHAAHRHHCRGIAGRARCAAGLRARTEPAGLRAVGAAGSVAAPDCPGEPRALRRQFRAAAGQAELFDAATALPVPPEPAGVPVAGHTRKGRPALPKDLPRTRIEYDLNDEQKATFDSLERIGEERSETLHYEPSRLTVIEHIRFKYAAKMNGESTIVTANAQPSPLPKSNASASLLANILVNTYVDHLPLNRQEMRYARRGVHLPPRVRQLIA
jgi:transposase